VHLKGQRTVDRTLVGRHLDVAFRTDLENRVASDVVELSELFSSWVGDVEAASLLAVVAVPCSTPPTTFQLAPTYDGANLLTSMSAPHKHDASLQSITVGRGFYTKLFRGSGLPSFVFLVISKRRVVSTFATHSVPRPLGRSR